MGRVIFDFVGGDDERNARLEAVMRKELEKMGIYPHRTPKQRRREAEIDAELEDAAWDYQQWRRQEGGADEAWLHGDDE